MTAVAGSCSQSASLDRAVTRGAGRSDVVAVTVTVSMECRDTQAGVASNIAARTAASTPGLGIPGSYWAIQNGGSISGSAMGSGCLVNRKPRGLIQVIWSRVLMTFQSPWVLAR